MLLDPKDITKKALDFNISQDRALQIQKEEEERHEVKKLVTKYLEQEKNKSLLSTYSENETSETLDGLALANPYLQQAADFTKRLEDLEKFIRNAPPQDPDLEDAYKMMLEYEPKLKEAVNTGNSIIEQYDSFSSVTETTVIQKTTQPQNKTFSASNKISVNNQEINKKSEIKPNSALVKTYPATVSSQKPSTPQMPETPLEHYETRARRKQSEEEIIRHEKQSREMEFGLF